MGYYVTIQKNPHEHDRPCYAEGDAANVVELQFDDDGVEADALHELIGIVVGRGKSLDADAIDDYRRTVKRLRERLREVEDPDPSDRMVDTDDAAPDGGSE